MKFDTARIMHSNEKANERASNGCFVCKVKSLLI